jgi:hypothetical protein
MRSGSIVKLHVIVNQIQILGVAQNCIGGEFIKCPTSLSDFKEIWSAPTCFHKGSQYKIS